MLSTKSLPLSQDEMWWENWYNYHHFPENWPASKAQFIRLDIRNHGRDQHRPSGPRDWPNVHALFMAEIKHPKVWLITDASPPVTSVKWIILTFIGGDVLIKHDVNEQHKMDRRNAHRVAWWLADWTLTWHVWQSETDELGSCPGDCVRSTCLPGRGTFYRSRRVHRVMNSFAKKSTPGKSNDIFYLSTFPASQYGAGTTRRTNGKNETEITHAILMSFAYFVAHVHSACNGAISFDTMRVLWNRVLHNLEKALFRLCFNQNNHWFASQSQYFFEG